MIKLLVDLGTAMSELTPNGLPPDPTMPAPTVYPQPSDSNIPAGYTYLAQFLAHEITFDSRLAPPDWNFWPKGLRSPQIDLDSLYGLGPDSPASREIYDPVNPGELKLGQTAGRPGTPPPLDSDLPRDPVTRQAYIGDRRNDENLAVAQLHVAFIKFHNHVVRLLKEKNCPPRLLLGYARTIVVRHFQWIILNDLLDQLLDHTVLDKVKRKKAWYFTKRTERAVFMPVEFSVAAFRFGHSMVRRTYEWNLYHSTDLYKQVPAELTQLLEQTEFSGRIGKDPKIYAVESDWIIDWRRFFDFSPMVERYPPARSGINRAGKIDRVFNLHLESIQYFDHQQLKQARRFITVRNLLRGFALRLPSGETVAKRLNEPVLSRQDLLSGPYDNVASVLAQNEFKDNTPLWYYILKEAEVLNDGERLGPVGSRIVAETIVGLINRSCYSIFRPARLPKFARVLPEPSEANFKMINLLDMADVVNPIGGN